jgi:hypothetical protein
MGPPCYGHRICARWPDKVAVPTCAHNTACKRPIAYRRVTLNIAIQTQPASLSGANCGALPIMHSIRRASKASIFYDEDQESLAMPPDRGARIFAVPEQQGCRGCVGAPQVASKNPI